MDTEDCNSTVPLLATQNSFPRGPVDSPVPLPHLQRQRSPADALPALLPAALGLREAASATAQERSPAHKHARGEAVPAGGVANVDVDEEDCDASSDDGVRSSGASVVFCSDSTVNAIFNTPAIAATSRPTSADMSTESYIHSTNSHDSGRRGGGGSMLTATLANTQVPLPGDRAVVQSAAPTPAPPQVPFQADDVNPLLDESPSTSPSAPPHPQSYEEAPRVTLSDEQLYAYEQVVRRLRSVFITGGAGTGKSHLLRTIIAALPRSTTFVTATTGLAALHLGGTTLHGFAGCGIVERGTDPGLVLARVLGSGKRRTTWRSCKILVIDEVSMLDAWLFDVLDFVARRVRNELYTPFGGIQLILSGDYLQLPPVVANRRTGVKGGSRQSGDRPMLCFESNTWLRANPHVCLLTRPYRQRDESFFSLLNELRFGVPSPESVALLNRFTSSNTVNFVQRTPAGLDEWVKGEDVGRQHVVLTDEHGVAYPSEFDGFTILRPFRAEVDAENERYFSRLSSVVYMYHGSHTGRGSYPHQSIPERVRLREGCRVMLTKNYDTQIGLANGSTGTVTGFIDWGRGYHFANAKTHVGDAQRICKGRGGDCEAPHTLIPVVRFDIRRPDGTMEARELVVEPSEWTEMCGEEVVSRTVQIPLVLAYAITIHKAQGMSLTHVDIDFKNIFEAGQAYVALSRCTDLNNVRLHSFTAHVVTPNPAALAYYRALGLSHEREAWSRLHGSSFTAGGGVGGCSQYDGPEHLDDCAATPYGYSLPPDYARQCREHLAARQLEGLRKDEEGLGLCILPNESTRIEAVRANVAPLLELSAEVWRRVKQSVTAAERVHNARFVMDVGAFFDLITGTQSAMQYDTVFVRHGNAIRVPLVVRETISAAAAFGTSAAARDFAVASTTSTTGTTTTGTISGGCRVENDCDGASSAAELSEAAAVAAEVLVLLERAKSEFVVDEQREGERMPLPAPSSAWTQFAEVLPLLQPGEPTSIVVVEPAGSQLSQSQSALHSESGGALAGPDAMMPHPLSTASEFDFLLNRDPREAEQHKHLLEYATYLRETHGNDVIIGTDSPTLAACALAFGFCVASLGFLRG